MTTRRGFLAGILAAGFAPAAVGSGILMPVKRIAVSIPEVSELDRLLFELRVKTANYAVERLLMVDHAVRTYSRREVELFHFLEQNANGFVPLLSQSGSK